MDGRQPRPADRLTTKHEESIDRATDDTQPSRLPVAELRKKFDADNFPNDDSQQLRPGRYHRSDLEISDDDTRYDDTRDDESEESGDEDGDDDAEADDDDNDKDDLEESPEEEKNTIRLLLLGKTGTGKSTTGNTIFGEERFNTSPSFGSVTADCERHTGERGVTSLEIMDTPGLYDTNKTQEEICTLVVQAVAGMHPGPHAVLFVIKVGRFTPEEFAAYNRLKAIFDNDITRHVILVFTHGDQLENEGVTLESLLYNDKTPKDLTTILEECEHRFLSFNNKAENPGPQVDELLDMVQTLIKSHNEKPYSSPKYTQVGKAIEKEVTKRIEKYEKQDLKRMKVFQKLKQMTEAAEKKVEETQKESKRKQEEMEREVQIERMKALKLQELNKKREMERKIKKMEDLFEEKRRKDIKKEEKEKKALERKRQRQLKETKKEEERKEKQRMAEMEGLKDGVVKNQESGFVTKTVGLVTKPVRAILGFFKR